MEQLTQTPTTYSLPMITLAEHWWAYLALLGIIGFMLIMDLGVFHRRPHTVSFKEATMWSIVWIIISGLFNVGLYIWAKHQFSEQPELAQRLAGEFLAGYVVEKSLAVDNIFVIAPVDNS